MRTIKFRAWSPSNGCWCASFSIHKSGKTSDMIDTKIDKDSGLAISDAHWGENDLEIMQFTGLLDKNGVEVFEGDVVAIGEPQVKFKVVFEDGAFIFKGKYKFFPLHEAEFFEVIGNIYEHPHLLEANND